MMLPLLLYKHSGIGAVCAYANASVNALCSVRLGYSFSLHYHITCQLCSHCCSQFLLEAFSHGPSFAAGHCLVPAAAFASASSSPAHTARSSLQQRGLPCLLLMSRQHCRRSRWQRLLGTQGDTSDALSYDQLKKLPLVFIRRSRCMPCQHQKIRSSQHYPALR